MNQTAAVRFFLTCSPDTKRPPSWETFHLADCLKSMEMFDGSTRALIANLQAHFRFCPPPFALRNLIFAELSASNSDPIKREEKRWEMHSLSSMQFFCLVSSRQKPLHASIGMAVDVALLHTLQAVVIIG